MPASRRTHHVLEIADTPTVAGATTLRWDELDRATKHVFAYRCIVVVPASGSERTQRELLDQLRSESHLGRWRAIWVLNEHVIAEITEACGFGRVVRRDLPAGIIKSAFRRFQPLPSQVRYVPEGLASGTIAVAYWRSAPDEPLIPIATVSSDLRWAATPPAADLSGLIELNPNSYRRVFVALVAVLLIAIGWFGAHERSKAHTAYLQGHSAIADFDARSQMDGLAEPERGALPAARLAERLLSSRRSMNMLRLAAQEADGSSLSPEELWAQSQLPQSVRSSAYFRLALLSGDLVSAFRILLQTDFKNQDRHRWAVLLTETLWQTAVESLQELDFRRAQTFTELYLDSMDRVSRRNDEYDELGPERNRTLARILFREAKSSRIKSVCNEPAQAMNFGRLLGGDWGDRIEPVSSRDREERIRKNRAEQCRKVPRTLRVSYDALVKADDFYASNEGPRHSDYRDLAQLVPLEYKYLRGRASITDANEGGYDPTIAATGLKALLEIAQRPSYLSDDALFTAAFQVTTVEPGLPAAEVAHALETVQVMSGDYVESAVRTVAQVDCARFDWTGFRSDNTGNPTMREIGRRCGH